MRYFKTVDGLIYGYDDNQRELILAAAMAGWEDITSSFPPTPTITKTDVQVNIDNVVTDLNGKADKGDYYEVVDIPAIEKTLDELKAEKLQELKTAFQNTRETAHCMCALGFEVDANEDANTNIVGLITVMKEGETTMFRAYDNSFHEVSREDLITIRNNIIKNSQFLYQMKWGMESRINNAVKKN